MRDGRIGRSPKVPVPLRIVVELGERELKRAHAIAFVADPQGAIAEHRHELGLRGGTQAMVAGGEMRDDPRDPARTRQAARCGAKRRSGTPCRSPAVTGRKRCRMHGGAPGSGGPKGLRTGNYRRGRYTAQAVATRTWVRQCVRDVRALTKRLRQT